MTLPNNAQPPLAASAIRPVVFSGRALGALILLTTAMRFLVAHDRPLWLDEVWTGMIATQPSFNEFVARCVNEVNGPLYYIVDAIWAWVGGVSDFSLRFPAAVFGAAAPLIALSTTTTLDKNARYIWCALLACWIPGIWFSQEARCYTLMVLLAVANTITFVSLLKSPTQRSAWVWASIGSLLILSHYYCTIHVGIQGLVYLAMHKGRALRTWPAAIAFIPPFAALGVHAANLIAFVRPGSAWFPVLKSADLPWILGWLLGDPLLIPAFFLWAAAALLFRRKNGDHIADEPARGDRLLWIAVACAVVATAIAVGLGFLRPMFVVRYLTGFAPGLLLGLALLARSLSRDWRMAPTLLIAMYLFVAVRWGIDPGPHENAFNFERASYALLPTAPKRLVFLWDTPMSPEPSSLRGVAGFFFARAGHPVVVDPVSVSRGMDPNPILLREAAGPDTAILWIYDTEVAGTAAIRHPPTIGRLDPRWRCGNYGLGPFGVIACNRAKNA